VVNQWPLISEAGVWSQANTCEIGGEQSGIRTGSCPKHFSFPLSVFLPPMLHPHLHQHVVLIRRKNGRGL